MWCYFCHVGKTERKLANMAFYYFCYKCVLRDTQIHIREKRERGVDGRHTKTKTPNNACEEKWSQASLYYLEGSGADRVCIN